MSCRLFFASDHHFSHELMVGLRGFKTPEEMNEVMIERHNKVVRPQDHVYFLGDIAMKRKFLPIVRRFNGHKRLIFGNHDIFDYKEYAKAGFEKMMSYRVLDGMIFSHIPVHPGQLRRFKVNIHGHTHENRVIHNKFADPLYQVTGEPSIDERYICVCVEQIDYTPISLEDIKKKISNHE